MQSNLIKPPLRAVPMTLFPTMETLQEVIEYGEAAIPIENRNVLYALMMTYHNTVLKVLTERGVCK